MLPTNSAEFSPPSASQTLARHEVAALGPFRHYATFRTLDKSFFYLQLFHLNIRLFFFFSPFMLLTARFPPVLLLAQHTELVLALSAFLNSRELEFFLSDKKDLVLVLRAKGTRDYEISALRFNALSLLGLQTKIYQFLVVVLREHFIEQFEATRLPTLRTIKRCEASVSLSDFNAEVLG